MRKIELNGRGWWKSSRPLNHEPTVIDDDDAYFGGINGKIIMSGCDAGLFIE